MGTLRKLSPLSVSTSPRHVMTTHHHGNEANMQFTLDIALCDDNVANDGIDTILPAMLRKVAERCETGHADGGAVLDGNGNVVGGYSTLTEAELAEITADLAAIGALGQQGRHARPGGQL